MSDRDLLAALRAEIRSIVREEIATARAPERATDVYATCGPLPPGRSRRWLREHAPRIPGAVRSGPRFGRGVVWTVPRAAYEAWLTSREGARPARVAAAPPSNVVDVDEWIGRAGYRLSHRATRGER